MPYSGAAQRVGRSRCFRTTYRPAQPGRCGRRGDGQGSESADRLKFGREFAEPWREHFDQFPEPGFVVAPQVDRTRIDRLPDLLRTRRLDRALRFVEAQAVRLERQPAEGQQPADLAFQVGHNVLIVYVQHEARHDAMPVLHQPPVLQVVFAELHEVVAEGLAAREQLLVGTEAAVERVAAGIDDPGIRQGEANQPGEHEIVRVLVYEAGRPRAAILRCAGEVILSQARPVGGAQLCHRVGKTPLGGRAAAQVPDHPGQVGQLVRAFHPAVAREYLFDQG